MRAVALVDYKMGNVRSVANALEAVGATVTLASTPDAIRHADRLVLPGVGAFEDAMRQLQEPGLVDAMSEVVREKQRPFLGICLGMQLVASSSEEHGEHQGLGWIEGKVQRIPVPADVRVPHVGWNDLKIQRSGGLFDDSAAGACFYFVHSFSMRPADESIISATSEYGGVDLVAAIERDNIHATQFHPEKSQRHGLRLLTRFLEL